MEDLANFVQGSADEIAVGIERAAAFLMTQQAGAGLGRIYLSGGGARIPKMPEALGLETYPRNGSRRDRG
jgi:Tfp pilus assembly PilM family ATPase